MEFSDTASTSTSKCVVVKEEPCLMEQSILSLEYDNDLDHTASFPKLRKIEKVDYFEGLYNQDASDSNFEVTFLNRKADNVENNGADADSSGGGSKMTQINSSDTLSSSGTFNESLDCATIKEKIASGVFKTINIKGRSKVWSIFFRIQNETGALIENKVICKICSNVFAFSTKSTSNLVKHKCYKLSERHTGDEMQKMQVDALTKQAAVRTITQWTIENCRTFKIVEDSGFKKFVEFLISTGAKYGPNVDIKTLLPHPTIISRNITMLFPKYFEKIKNEISSIKYGFSLTTDLWTDNFLRTSYLALTIHYIKDGQLISRLLGLKSMQGERSTNEAIKSKVINLLREFDCKIENAFIVSDTGSNMVAAFRSYKHIFCINHLLRNILESSIKEVTEVAEMCNACTKLVKFFKKSGLNSNLETTLKSFSCTRWNADYYMLTSIEKNWTEITRILKSKNELDRINDININIVSAITKLLHTFEKATKAFEAEISPTLHMVIVHFHRLKKICAVDSEDQDNIREFKEKLNKLLTNLVFPHITIYHKIALFLFPPANSLIQCDETEKCTIKAECKKMMSSHVDEVYQEGEQTTPTAKLSNHNAELFSDYITQMQLVGSEEKVNNELTKYENTKVNFYDDFNLLQWWHLNRVEFPLLYRVSCKILSAPATSAASERTFSVARHLISEKRCVIDSNSSTSLNEILFLHLNIPKEHLMNEIENVNNV